MPQPCPPGQALPVVSPGWQAWPPLELALLSNSNSNEVAVATGFRSPVPSTPETSVPRILLANAQRTLAHFTDGDIEAQRGKPLFCSTWQGGDPRFGCQLHHREVIWVGVGVLVGSSDPPLTAFSASPPGSVAWLWSVLFAAHLDPESSSIHTAGISEYLLWPGPGEWAGMGGHLSPLAAQPWGREVNGRQHRSCLLRVSRVLIPALPLTGPVTPGEPLLQHLSFLSYKLGVMLGLHLWWGMNKRIMPASATEQDAQLEPAPPFLFPHVHPVAISLTTCGVGGQELNETFILLPGSHSSLPQTRTRKSLLRGVHLGTHGRFGGASCHSSLAVAPLCA